MIEIDPSAPRTRRDLTGLTAHDAGDAARPDDRGRPVLTGVGLRRSFGVGAAALEVLRGVDVTLPAGTITALMGPSGSGKSTLLHLLSGLDTPDAGEVRFEGERLAGMREAELARWRATRVGFVLQRDNLVPSLTVGENVAAPLILAGVRRAEALGRAREMLARVGLGDRSGAWPAELSGGEAQRVAVARACSNRPSVVFADEPTGALDSVNGEVVLELLWELVSGLDAAALVVTHDPGVAARADRVLRMMDGRLEPPDEP